MKQFNLTFTLSVLVITVFTTETFTQVTTRVLGDDLQFDHFMPYPVDHDIIYHLQPEINFEAEVEY